MIRDILVGPHQISFDITNKCNLRCLHCYNNSGENLQSCNELSDEEVLTFIDGFKDIKLLNLCFCGGETLLRKDLIVEASKRLRSYGCENIAMVTNGILLTKETLDELINAGVNRIQVSLDGITAKSHDKIRNKAGVFEKAIAAINYLSNCNIEYSVAFTPTSFNVDEFVELHDYLHKIGMNNQSNLRVQPLMVMGRASNNIKDIQPSDKQYRQLVNTIRKINQASKSPRIDWGDPVDHLIRFRHMNIILNSIMIRANGELIVDPYLPLVLGNIRNHSFEEYWNHGLNKIWENDLVKELANNIMCIEDMDKEFESIPKIWRDKDILIDLIDDDFETVSKNILNQVVIT